MQNDVIVMDLLNWFKNSCMSVHKRLFNAVFRQRDLQNISDLYLCYSSVNQQN